MLVAAVLLVVVVGGRLERRSAARVGERWEMYGASKCFSPVLVLDRRGSGRAESVLFIQSGRGLQDSRARARMVYSLFLEDNSIILSNARSLVRGGVQPAGQKVRARRVVARPEAFHARFGIPVQGGKERGVGRRCRSQSKRALLEEADTHPAEKTGDWCLDERLLRSLFVCLCTRLIFASLPALVSRQPFSADKL